MNDLVTPDNAVQQITGYLCPATPSAKTADCQKMTVYVSELPNQQVFTFDYGYMGQIWGLAFTSVLFLYLFCVGIGQILKLVKNA